jgi:hypothetical protein
MPGVFDLINLLIAGSKGISIFALLTTGLFTVCNSYFMNYSSLVLNTPTGNNYDDCLVAGFLKRCFSKTRSAKTAPELVIHNHVSEVKEALNQLKVGAAPEISFEYLSALEKSLPGISFRYAVINRDNVPVLFAYFQLFTITSKNFKLEKNKTFIKGIFRFFLDFHKIRILQLGNSLRTETESYSYDTKAFTGVEALEAIAAVAEKIAADEKVAAVILKDIPGIASSAGSLLNEMGYRKPWNDQVMEMAVESNWKSLADYTAALSRKYKARANKALAARNLLKIIPLSLADLHKYEPEMNHLCKEVADKQEFIFSKLDGAYFTSLKHVYGEDFEVSGYFLDGKLVAFYSAFINAGAYEIYYIGIDYAANNDYQLYFNILFSGLERAISLRKSVLKLGRTSFDAKASLGANPKSLDYLIKLAGIPDFVIKWFVCYFSSLEDGKWKQRSPLKNAEAKIAQG